MRARLAALAAAATVALSGCGGDEEASPLDDALGHLPADAPAVIVFETDPEHPQWEEIGELISEFPFAGQIRAGARRELAPEPLDFDDDVEPQLGNEVVFGVPEAKGEDNFVVAVKVKDAQRAERDIVPELEDRGYEARIDDGMLVVADSKPVLDAAREQRDKDDRLREDEFEDDLGRLAEDDPLMRGTVDLAAALESNPPGAAARAIPWINSLRGLAFAGSVRGKALAVDLELETQSNPDDELPLAPGPQSPPVPRRDGEITIAARDPGRTLGLVERLREVLPRTDEHSKALNDALERIDVNVQRDLIAPIGDLGAVAIAPDGTSVARADLEEPALFARTLERLATRLAGAARGDVGFTIEPGGGEGFYRLNAERGRQVFVGVVGDQVVLGREAGSARDFADDPARPVPGARGSVVVFADTQSVANAVIQERATGPEAFFGQAFTDPLGDMRGWVETRPTGMSGHLELEIE